MGAELSRPPICQLGKSSLQDFMADGLADTEAPAQKLLHESVPAHRLLIGDDPARHSTVRHPNRDNGSREARAALHRREARSRHRGNQLIGE